MFTVIIVLVAAVLGFRLLGVLGAGRFVTWPVCAAHGLAVMLVVTASAHFVPAGVTVMPNHADLVAMLPSFVPLPDVVIYGTGVLELLGAVGLVVAATRWVAGLGLAVLFVLLLPANIYAAVADVPFNGEAASPLWVRIPEQLLYIAVALWVARSADITAARRMLTSLRTRIRPAEPMPAMTGPAPPAPVIIRVLAHRSGPLAADPAQERAPSCSSAISR